MHKYIKSVISGLILSTMLIWSSCSKDPFTVIEKIEVKTQGSFAFTDGLTLATKKEKEYELFVLTNTDGADIYYSINEAEPVKLKGYWITVDSTVNILDFYTSSNKFNTENFRLNIGFENDSILGSITSVYPNPTTDLLSVKMIGHNRGEVKIEVMHVTGKLVLSKTFFKDTNETITTLSLGSFENGIYFLRVIYGDASSVYRILKTKV